MQQPSKTHQLDRGALALIELALAEDVGSGDITTLATVPAVRQASGVMLAKQSGVISGLAVVSAVYARVDERVVVEPLVADGEAVEIGTAIVRVSGPAQALLSGERVALNFLQRLSGVATVTAAYVRAAAGTRARIVDTRKTTPGMRTLQKQAIRDGGGHNHRLGLADGVLIKDNHLAAIGTPDRIGLAVIAARERAPHTLRIEIEVTNLDELREALAAGADIVMLDNMDIATMAEAVRISAGRALLEASGGITLQTIPAIAATGVDLISVGALTHSAPSLDISLEFDVDPPVGAGLVPGPASPVEARGREAGPGTSPAPTRNPAPRNVTSVGALVVSEGRLLVVKMAYGPSQGRWMIPGGLLDPGETLDTAAAREVLEETGVVAQPLGIVGIRSRSDGLNTDTYVLWLLEPLSGEPTPDDHEIEATQYMTFEEIAARDDVVYLVKYLAAHLSTNQHLLHTRATDYTYQFPGTTPETWKLFV